MKEFERVWLFILQSVMCHVLHSYLDTSKNKLVRSELIQNKKQSPVLDLFWPFNLKCTRTFYRLKYLFLREEAEVDVSLSLIRNPAFSIFASLPLKEETLEDASSRTASIFPSQTSIACIDFQVTASQWKVTFTVLTCAVLHAEHAFTI